MQPLTPTIIVCHDFAITVPGVISLFLTCDDWGFCQRHVSGLCQDQGDRRVSVPQNSSGAGQTS